MIVSFKFCLFLKFHLRYPLNFSKREKFEKNLRREHQTLPTLSGYGVIHLKRTQNFPKSLHFLPPDAYQGVRNVSFSENFA